jgi:peptide/nickel transport system permease protein
MMPGDPTTYLAADQRLPASVRLAVAHEFGLDRSVWYQFIAYLTNILHGNLGVSFSYYPKPVLQVLSERLPWSIALLVISQLLAALIGVFLGVTAAWKRGSKIDTTILAFSLAMSSTPIFWIGMLLLLVFAFYFPIFPLAGGLTPGAIFPSTFDFLMNALWHMVLPVFALTLVFIAGSAFTMRNTMIDIMGEDFILLAEAKGIGERAVKFGHAARNAMLPVVTGITLNLGYVVGGAVFTETVFSYPGVGLLIFNAVLARDYPLLQGAFLLIGITVILANIAADVLYALLDPRIKY